MLQTREELEKQGLIMPKEEIEKYARAEQFLNREVRNDSKRV